MNEDKAVFDQQQKKIDRPTILLLYFFQEKQNNLDRHKKILNKKNGLGATIRIGWEIQFFPVCGIL